MMSPMQTVSTLSEARARPADLYWGLYRHASRQAEILCAMRRRDGLACPSDPQQVLDVLMRRYVLTPGGDGRPDRAERLVRVSMAGGPPVTERVDLIDLASVLGDGDETGSIRALQMHVSNQVRFIIGELVSSEARRKARTGSLDSNWEPASAAPNPGTAQERAEVQGALREALTGMGGVDFDVSRVYASLGGTQAQVGRRLAVTRDQVQGSLGRLRSRLSAFGPS